MTLKGRFCIVACLVIFVARGIRRAAMVAHDDDRPGSILQNGERHPTMLLNGSSLPANSILQSQSSPWPFDDAADVKAYLIHVGKTGGSSLTKKLNLQSVKTILPCRMNVTISNIDDCEQNMRSSSMLKRHLYGWFHLLSPFFTNEQKEWLDNNTNLLIFTIRDPVDRVVSALNYHRHAYFGDQDPRPYHTYPKRKLAPKIFLLCFPTAQDLARAVGPVESNTTSKYCRKLGFELVKGHAPLFPCQHLQMNYQYYAKKKWKDRSKPVVVLRTESLWSDTAHLESLLGGNPESITASTMKYTHGSENYKVKSGVTAEGAKAMCCGLREELEVYRDLVVAAVNLNVTEKIQTLSNALNKCGIQRNVSPQNVLGFKWLAWDCQADYLGST